MKFLIPKADKYRSGIYIISNTVNSKIYIGSARNLRHRFISHRNTLSKNRHRSPQLQSFVNMYGIECLVFDALCFCQIEELLTMEQKYLDLKRPFGKKGFNTLTVAGSPLGLKHKEAAKLKISKAHKGRKHTPEAKANMKAGQVNRNWFPSDEYREATSKRFKGRVISENHRALISKAHKGRKHTEQSRTNMSNAHKGKKLTEEQKRNQSIEMLNRNPFGKLVLNTETGIYYDSGIQAAKAHNIHAVGLNRKLSGARKNNTPFILA